MSIIKLIISDLHLADGHPVLDGFGDYQQAAFEGLLHAAGTSGSLGQADDVELIINGDCFDFLIIPPYETRGVTDPTTALGKLEKIIAVHTPFFRALSDFIKIPGRHVTLITGNHDIELRFEEVRTRILQAMSVGEGAINFCPTRFYRPLPDVHIEHGNYFDFWNHHIQGIWDEQGQPLTLKPETITLPFGSLYYQAAGILISTQYPYFDHFEPSMNYTRQVALLCLLNRSIVKEVASRTMALLSEPRDALIGLSPEEEHIPARLFEQAMIDFAAFEQDIIARKTDWHELPLKDHTQLANDPLTEFTMLREALSLPFVEAVTAVCTPTLYQMGEAVAAGMHHVLQSDPTLRYALAGHTHMTRIDPINQGAQVYLNTGSWTTRLAIPAPGEITPALIDWLRQPDWNAIPLRDRTQLLFALVNAKAERSATGEDELRSSASLCVWEGGTKGNYRVLA